MAKKVVAGIDIGGTNTRIGLVDDKGNILSTGHLDTNKYLVFDSYIKDVYDEIRALLAANDYELMGVGVGAPNGNHRTGCIDNAVNLAWKQVPVVAMLKEYYPTLPVKLTNDANAATIAEMIYGNAKGLTDFIVVTLGTGLGSGFVVNGELVYGHDGLAGELGHVIVADGGRECNCGRRGCLETYVSATGIKRTIMELQCDSSKRNDCSALRDIAFNKLSGKNIDEAARKGDIIAKRAFEITGEILGKCLAHTVAITSPSAIFLFGGLAEASELILEPTRESFKKNLLQCYKQKDSGEPKTKIIPSGLGNKNAGLLGAASLIWKELT